MQLHNKINSATWLPACFIKNSSVPCHINILNTDTHVHVYVHVYIHSHIHLHTYLDINAEISISYPLRNSEKVLIKLSHSGENFVIYVLYVIQYTL